MHDPLTQLFNRRWLDAMLPGLQPMPHRRGAPLAVALIDLDHFKQINDRYGHPAGDLVLKHIGRLFSTSLRLSDVLSIRWAKSSASRFRTPMASAHKGARRFGFCDFAPSALKWNGQRLEGFTFSAGVAVHPAHGQTVGDLVASADRALYEAKGSGRDRVLMAAALPAADRGVRRKSSAA
jgi:diguanylate cyclase (GGDEF)-like protein